MVPEAQKLDRPDSYLRRAIVYLNFARHELEELTKLIVEGGVILPPHIAPIPLQDTVESASKGVVSYADSLNGLLKSFYPRKEDDGQADAPESSTPAS